MGRAGDGRTSLNRGALLNLVMQLKGRRPFVSRQLIGVKVAKGCAKADVEVGRIGVGRRRVGERVHDRAGVGPPIERSR